MNTTHAVLRSGGQGTPELNPLDERLAGILEESLLSGIVMEVEGDKDMQDSPEDPGIVLLCLMGAVLGQDRWNYTWNGPGQTDPTDPNTENICLPEKYCGCCAMQRYLQQAKDLFNKTVNILNQELENAQATINNIRASRTAFSVALNKTRRCFGPMREEVPVVYEYIFVNMGESYNMTSGVFTAPHSGIYSLALTVYSDAGPLGTLAACINLRLNGRDLAVLREKNDQDQEDSATVVLAIQLQAKDRVSVHLPIGCYLCDDKSHFNTFTGYLLYTTD